MRLHTTWDLGIFQAALLPPGIDKKLTV